MVSKRLIKRTDRDKDLGVVRVRLLESAARSPTTQVEQWIAALLKSEGPMRLSELMREVSDRIYLDELRRGAAVLDLGLFGPDFFVPHVTTELKAGNGILWLIERPKEEG